jgi:hypothetical protein
LSSVVHAPRHNRANLRRATRYGVALLASAALSTAPLAQSLDLGNDGLIRNNTYAYGEGLRTWDNIKKYGAERVVDRDRTPYQPDGLRAGTYKVFPTLGTTVLFDDNIFGTNKNRTADVRFELVPVVRARSDFSRHVLDFAVGAKQINYLRHSELNSTDANFSMDGALHFDNAHTLSLSLLSALDHEDRAAPDAPKNAGERTAVFHNRAIAGIKRDAGRMWASFSTSVERWDFQDVRARNGALIDQDNRDTQIAAAQASLGYRFSPGYELEMKLRTLRQSNFNPGSVDFSANGYEAIGGLSAEVNPLLRWRLLAGYGLRDYDSSKLRTAGHMLVEGEVQWLPTQLMTVYLTGRRAYAEGIIGDGAGARLDNSLSAKVEYEALRNLVFTLGGEYRQSDFLSENRRDTVMIGRIGADYYHTKNWLFSVAYEHQTQRSNVEEDNLVRNRVWLTTKLRF